MWCVEGSAGQREVCVEVGAEDGLHGGLGERLGRREEEDGVAYVANTIKAVSMAALIL